MKKFLLTLLALSSTTAMAETHLYGKFASDLVVKYSSVKEEGKTTFASDRGRGAGIFLEATKDIVPNTELGLGIGYIRRSNGKHVNHEYERSVFIEKDDEIIVETTERYNSPRYASVPLYLVGKYNFDLGMNLKPYIKADLGYSLNHANEKITKEAGFKANPKVKSQETIKAKVKNGIYAGVAIGAEYNNFLTELSYHYTEAKISLEGKSHKYNNNSFSFAVGYKFNF
ncbi:MAG: outer membrane beta-barrel protein [Fusobacterium necrophorum]|nr:porin family protein [Fusobacterium necrophorum]MCI7681630.1 porin family protein [Fusobacterium necrophorum]MDY2573359.1 outer membrane beta-barrel protein [Fusobacterium necrophorum]MDY6171967.1 outer membrane beta-barrel protein [Fusobacterium necrophorum]